MAIHSRHERDTMQHATQDLTFFYFSINFWDNDILITFMKIYIYISGNKNLYNSLYGVLH